MTTRRIPLLAAAALVLALPLAACGSDDGSSDTTTVEATDAPTVEATGSVPDGPTISIGAQDFGESAVLAEIYGQALEAAGYPVSQEALGGFRDLVFSAFDSGDINLTPEYAASALEFLNDFAGEATSDPAATVALLQTQLESRGLVAFEPSPAIDSNSFVVTAETAERLGLENVSDLTADLRLGGAADCPDNASCLPGLSSTYDLDLSENFTPLDGGGPLTVAALDGGEIDVAILYSTDGTIADKGWVVLTDDKGLINADNIVPIGSQELADTYGEAFTTLVNKISASLDTAELTELNRRVGIELEDAGAVALSWLQAEGLVS